MQEDTTTEEEHEIFVAYFGTTEIRRNVTKSRVIVRNYLLQRVSQFQIDGIVKDISHTHNYIFALTPSYHRIYIFRVDSSTVYSLDLDTIPENPKFEHIVNVTVEMEQMHRSADCGDQIAELAHCQMQQPELSIKSNSSNIDDFLICATSRSCFLARNRANSEPSLYRIFSENKINDFQLLQLESVKPIQQLSAGNDHILILTVDGKVYSMGTGSRGELGHGTLKSEQHPRLVECLTPLIVIKVACGSWHSAALTDSGDVYLWGWNNFGQLGDCCQIGEILDVPVPLDIGEVVVNVVARGNGTWLRRADQCVLTLGSTTLI